MTFKDVASKIAQAAPLLGTVLGGPAGGAIGGVISAVASAFGLKPDDVKKDPQKLVKAIETDPEAALKLKQLEMEMQSELRKLALEQDRLRLQDVADARKRELAIVQRTGKKDINLYILAWTIVFGFFFLCGLLLYIPIPKESNQVVFMLFGALSAGFGQVLQYFFGSSRDFSVQNQALLKKHTQKS